MAAAFRGGGIFDKEAGGGGGGGGWGCWDLGIVGGVVHSGAVPARRQRHEWALVVVIFGV